jgi:hypothetical protein
VFEIPRFTGLKKRSIVIQTRKGNDGNLNNYIGPEPDYQAMAAFNLLLRTHGDRWQLRKRPCGGYNCAGMVWASRRAVLPDPVDWRRVLSDDQYRQLRHDEKPMPGDVAAYIREGGKEILHVARICHVRYGTPPLENINKTWAISKLHMVSGEVIHDAQDVPPLDGGERFTIEYWTDRH